MVEGIARRLIANAPRERIVPAGGLGPGVIREAADVVRATGASADACAPALSARRSRLVLHVRKVHVQPAPGGDRRTVPGRGAGGVRGAVEPRAGAARPDRPGARPRARGRPCSVGAAAALGEGRQGCVQDDQRQGGDARREARVPVAARQAPLPRRRGSTSGVSARTGRKSRSTSPSPTGRRSRSPACGRAALTRRRRSGSRAARSSPPGRTSWSPRFTTGCR